MTTRFDAGRRAILPLGGLAMLVLVLPATPSGAHTAELLIASALFVTGSIASILGRRSQGVYAIATAGVITVVATVDPINDASLRWLPLAVAPFVVILAAAAMSGRSSYWWIACIGGIVAGPLRALVYDPFLDPTCAACLHSQVALSHHPDLARAFLVLGSVVTAGALAAMAVRGARRWFLLVAASVAGVAIWVPELRIAAGAVAVVVIANDLIRTTTARRRVSRLVRALREDVDLEHTLRRELGDPTLAVAYWIDGDGRFAARTGGAAPDCDNRQITTELRMGDMLVAVIHHDPECAEVPALADALDGPARIALENERLAAQLASQRLELQRSRSRIVERGDRERRQLERDVHDSAQQHVLALGFDVRTALAGRPVDDPARPVLERCLAETTQALDDLRELSHGLYPPSLQAGGLVPALSALGRRAPVDVTIRTIPSERLPTPIERALFAVVADAAGTATRALDVEIEHRDSRVEMHVLGARGPSGQVAVDRISALNGSLTSDESTICAVIPCAS